MEENDLKGMGVLQVNKKNTSQKIAVLTQVVMLLILITGCVPFQSFSSDIATHVQKRLISTPIAPLLTAIPSSSPSPVHEPKIYTVMRTARVRSCSSTTCEQIALLEAGSQVSVIGSEQGEIVANASTWYIIERPDGQPSYVHSSLLREGVHSIIINTSVPATPIAWSCAGDLYDCDSFSTRAELMSYYNTCPGDPSNLDGNDPDDIPCEN